MAKMISAGKARGMVKAMRGPCDAAKMHPDYSVRVYPSTLRDYAATVLDLHKRLAAERCEPEGAASERWVCSRAGWAVQASPWWAVKRAFHAPEWLVYRNGAFIHAEPYALDAMRWCDEQDAKP